MGTKLHTTAAVDADEGFTGWVQIDGVDRASLSTRPATNAQLLLDHHAAPFPLRKGSCGASHGTRRWIAGQARPGLEAGRQTACRLDPNPRHVPRKLLVHQTGT